MKIETMNNGLVVAAKSATHAELSKHYSFISTDDVVDALTGMDYVITSSQQRVPRKASIEHASHLVRMRHMSDIESPTALSTEIVIRNAHDGHGALQMMSGLFRLVCANGLIVGDTNAIVRFNHSRKTTMDAVFDGARWVVNQAEKSKDAAARWSNVVLDKPAEIEFAKQINDFIRPDKTPFAAECLFAERYDEPRNLWTMFNNAQQSIMTGDGLRVGDNRRAARPVKEINATVKLNRALWNIAESFAA